MNSNFILCAEVACSELTVKDRAHLDVPITETLNPASVGKKTLFSIINDHNLESKRIVSSTYIDPGDAPITDAHWPLILSQSQYGSLARRQSSHDV